MLASNEGLKISNPLAAECFHTRKRFEKREGVGLVEVCQDCGAWEKVVAKYASWAVR